MRVRFFLYTLFVFVTVIAFAPTARAELSIGVIDVQLLLTDSKAAKSIQDQLREYREKLVDDLSKHEKELRGREQKLLEERSGLSSEEFLKKRSEFEGELLKTRRMVQEQKRALEEASADALNKLREQILLVSQEIAEARGYNLIVSKQNVVVAEKTIDASQEALKKLDEKIKKIPVVLKN